MQIPAENHCDQLWLDELGLQMQRDPVRCPGQAHFSGGRGRAEAAGREAAVVKAGEGRVRPTCGRLKVGSQWVYFKGWRI